MLRRKRNNNSLTSGNCTLRDEKERAYGFLSGRRDDGLRWKGNNWTSGNCCTLRDGEDAVVRLLGYEKVGLCCVGKGTA
jgi:hypothetical protein